MSDALRIDSHKLEFHPKRVFEWLDKKDDWETAKTIYPIYVEVSPVGACNHRCTFCAVDYIGYKNVQLAGALLRDRLREMAELGVKSVMFAGEGEPLLHKEINAITVGAKAAGLDVAFTTNGVLLNKLQAIDLCSWVKVSVNAGNRQTYAAVHRTKEKDWDTIWENIYEAAKRKGNCTLGVQMVLLKENWSSTTNLIDASRNAGVDYVVIKPYSQHKSSIVQMSPDYASLDDDIDYWQSFSTESFTVVVRDETAKTKEIPYEKCQATPYLWAYIMATGDVYSCSAYLLDERFRLGNINKSTFEHIWTSERRHENWRFVREELDIHECRVNCRQDKVNRYLTDLVNGVPHKNFI